MELEKPLLEAVITIARSQMGTLSVGSDTLFLRSASPSATFPTADNRVLAGNEAEVDLLVRISLRMVKNTSID